jgi:hypothetical protein
MRVKLKVTVGPSSILVHVIGATPVPFVYLFGQPISGDSFNSSG